jgi:hypothetical protein
MRETEAITNHVFSLLSSRAWDLMVGAGGFTRKAAAEIVENCNDDGISVDVSWPLHALYEAGLTVGYYEVDGLEFETADRRQDEVTSTGGFDAWLKALDEDPRSWAARAELMRTHLATMKPYFNRVPTGGH